MGLTTLRSGFQYVSGDKVYKGNQENTTPPAPSDIHWHREVVALEAYHQFTSYLGGGLGIPYYGQEIHNNATGIDKSASGIGDMFFYGIVSPWAGNPGEGREADPLSLPNLSMMVGLSVPTGDELKGEVPALHNFHLGSGSVEYKFSARYDARLNESFSAFGVATMTIDGGADSIGFRYGNGYDFQLGGTYAPINDLRFVVSFDAVVREQDRLGGAKLPDSGGTWWFVTLGALFSPVRGLWIEPSVAIPVYWRVNGSQPVSNEIWSLGIRFQF
jgi:hypothetical protein